MDTAKAPMTGRELRWLADNYEQAQQLRIAVGERIRAVLQQRDETFIAIPSIEAFVTQESEEDIESEVELKEIKKRNTAQIDACMHAIAMGDIIGPVPMLGRSYQRYYEEEQGTRKFMDDALDGHPVWPWMSQVKGIGPTLGAKLLARLDITKAPHRSSFWKFCGLATVPGEMYRCDTCGLTRGFPVGYTVTGKHQSLTDLTPKGNAKQCKGQLVLVAGPDDDVRVAQPRAVRGQKRDYDAYAKKVLYLCVSSFLKAGGPYEEYYRKQRARVEVERSGWAKGRKHYWAVRKTEKIFLAHIWEVWHEVEGLPVELPYPHAVLNGHTDIESPLDYIE